MNGLILKLEWTRQSCTLIALLCTIITSFFALSLCCSERKCLLFSGSRLPSEQLKLSSSFPSFSPLHYGLPHPSSSAPPTLIFGIVKQTNAQRKSKHTLDRLDIQCCAFPRKQCLCVCVSDVEAVSLAEVTLVLCKCNRVVSITVSGPSWPPNPVDRSKGFPVAPLRCSS